MPKGDIVDFLKDAASVSPDRSKLMLDALVDEIENSNNTNWNVVVANDRLDEGSSADGKVIGGVAYKLGKQIGLVCGGFF